MSNKTFLDLNEYCLCNILAYLDMKDHVNFSQVCQRFRQVVVTWSAQQYKDFITEKYNMKMFFITSENIEKLRVDFGEMKYILEKHSCDHQKNMLRNFCKQFQNMKALKSLEFNSRNSSPCNIFSDLNICDEMVKFLKDLPHLTELAIACLDEIYFNAFCELKLLTSFSASGLVDIHLKELCKSNENLSHLKVLHYYDGNILDIVPFCSNLKTLEFDSGKNVNNYAALAELPQLQVLKIRKLSFCDEIKLMCQKFASTNLLRELILFDQVFGVQRHVDLEETKEICKIKSLNRLECKFKDYECVKYVAQLTNLKKLFFDIQNNMVDLSDSVCHILRECKQMEYLSTHANGLPENFVFQAFKVLEVFRNPQEQKPLELVLPHSKFELSPQDKELCKSYVHFTRSSTFYQV